MSPAAMSVVQSTVQIFGAVVSATAVLILARGYSSACKRSQDWFRKALGNLHAAQTWQSFSLNCINLIEDPVTRERLQEAHQVMGEAMHEQAARFVAKAEQSAGLN